MMREAGGWSVKSASCAALAAALLFVLSGCTSRGITVTSLPEGAEVSINYRVVGNTPVRVAFTHYGTYRLELRKEKYQTLVREENIHPPAYGWDPGAFVADNLIPARLNDEVYLHFVMKPLEEKADKDALSERDALLQRAELARSGTVTNPRTGEQTHIELTHAPAKRIIEGGEEEEAPAGSEVASKDILLNKPVTLQSVVKEITTAKPEGSRLASEYNVEVAQPDKRGAFVPPEQENKAVASRVNRTAKDEELIYAQPPVDKGAQKSSSPESKESKK